MFFKWIVDEMFMLRSLPKVSSFSSNIQLQFKEKYLTTISIPMDSKSLKDLRQFYSFAASSISILNLN